MLESHYGLIIDLRQNVQHGAAPGTSVENSLQSLRLFRTAKGTARRDGIFAAHIQRMQGET